MILPDDTPESPSKLRPATLPAQEEEEAPLPAPPPAYPGHEQPSSSSSGYPYIRAGPSAEAQPILPPPVQYVYGRPVPARRRFCKAFAYAIFVYILAAMLVGSIVDGGIRRGGSRREDDHSSTARPLPQDGKVLHCLRGERGWSRENGKLSASFELERGSEELYLFKRGVKTSGNVVITQDERIRQDDLVHVDIVALPSSAGFLHAVSVCALERTPGKQGIGIFSPTRWDNRNQLPDLQFEVTVRLPRHSDIVPLQIAAFKSDLPNFSHHIRDLGEHVLFESLILKGRNAHISSKSVNAIDAAFDTTNAPITGHYQTSGSLFLRTSNDNINVTTVLRNDGLGPEPVTKLGMKTANGRLDAITDMVSTTDDGLGGEFLVEAATTNEKLTLNFPSAPVDSRQTVIASTTNHMSQVIMPQTFEGSVKVRTTNGFKAAAGSSAQGEDPSGRRRQRKVDLWCWGKSCDGTALWGGEHMGLVDVRATNAPAVLRL